MFFSLLSEVLGGVVEVIVRRSRRGQYFDATRDDHEPFGVDGSVGRDSEHIVSGGVEAFERGSSNVAHDRDQGAVNP